MGLDRKKELWPEMFCRYSRPSCSLTCTSFLMRLMLTIWVSGILVGSMAWQFGLQKQVYQKRVNKRTTILLFTVYTQMLATSNITLQGQIPSVLPSPHRSSITQSTKLPYFKRFAQNRFLSQERKRQQPSFFRKPQSPQPNPKYPTALVLTLKSASHAIKQKSEGKGKSMSLAHQSKPKQPIELFKQIFERESSNLRRKTECDHQYRRTSIHNSFNENKGQIKQQTKISAEDLKFLPQLRDYEKLELMHVKDIYYFGQHCKRKKMALSDMSKPNGSYNWLRGDHLNYQYEIIEQVGQGSFGDILHCYDHKMGRDVAVKVVRNREKYTRQAKTEIKILNQIKLKDLHGTRNCIFIRDFFMFRGHICMVFDLLSINLYEMLKGNSFHGLPLDLIRRMSLQILNALLFLHKNSIIHADLKPENILLKERNKSGVKVIDFGSSCHENETIYSYIQSRYYRAPEVMLGMPYDCKIDVWSFGCIVAELYLGYPLFGGENEHEMVCYFNAVLGPPPPSMKAASTRWAVFYDETNQLKDPKTQLKTCHSIVEALENPEDLDFIEFIGLCLQWDPAKRYSALQLFKHAWIIKGLPETILAQHLKFIEEESTDSRVQKSEALERRKSLPVATRIKLINN